jgi:hypothetical protein
MSERIISLQSENIKRLRAVHITPNGQSVEIAGANGAGKSSVLDSIWYALAGRSVLPDRPIRDGESRAEVTVELSNYTVTGTMAEIDESKAKALATAKFPLPGLSFSASGGVCYNGIPFSQISTAEQMRISAAIGLALNPGLRVMFIRNGSLIDSAGMETLKSLAESHNAQLWVERVGALSGELPGVVIEDGAVTQSTING